MSHIVTMTKLSYSANSMNVLVSRHNKVDGWNILHRLPLRLQQSVDRYTL